MSGHRNAGFMCKFDHRFLNCIVLTDITFVEIEFELCHELVHVLNGDSVTSSIALTAAGRTGDGTESLQARLQVRLGF